MSFNKKYGIMLILSGCVFNGAGIGEKPNLTEGSSESTTNSQTSFTSDINSTTSTNSTSLNIDPTTSETGVNSSTSGEMSSGSSTIEESTTFFTTTEAVSTSFGSSTTREPILCGDGILDDTEDCDKLIFKNSPTVRCSEKCEIEMLEKPLMYLTSKLVGMQNFELNQEEADVYCKLWTKNPTSKAPSFSVYDGVAIGYSIISNSNGPNAVNMKSYKVGWDGQPMYYYEPENNPFNPQAGQSLYVFQNCL